MPIEHEIKHILSDPEGKLLDHMRRTCDMVEIEQFYVTDQNRFRRATKRDCHGSASSEFTHTFKTKVDGKLLEIETLVSAADFDLACLVAKERVLKLRFPFDAGPIHWDVDFLLTAPLELGGTVRFVMAEAEFEVGGVYAIPAELARFVSLVVPHEDSVYFTNRHLALNAETALDDYAARRATD